jgi:hypothetical protein
VYPIVPVFVENEDCHKWQQSKSSDALLTEKIVSSRTFPTFRTYGEIYMASLVVVSGSALARDQPHLLSIIRHKEPRHRHNKQPMALLVSDRVSLIINRSVLDQSCDYVLNIALRPFKSALFYRLFFIYRFFLLRHLIKTMSSTSDENGEQEMDWSNPYQRVKFFFEYSPSDAEKVCRVR